MSADGERMESQMQQQQPKSTTIGGENCLTINSTKGPAPKAPMEGRSAVNGKYNSKKSSLPLFHEVINEPTSIYTIRHVRTAAEQVYEFMKIWTYRLISLIFALPCAILCGISVACCTFTGVWCLMPLTKLYRIPMMAMEQVMKTTMNTFLAPVFDAMGRCFGHNFVTSAKTPESPPHQRQQNDHTTQVDPCTV